MAKTPNDTPSPTGGTPGKESEVTLHDQTVPDSETGAHPEPEAYDFDFEYLDSSKGGAQKKDTVPGPDGQPVSGAVPKKDPPPAAEPPPTYAVPPIANTPPATTDGGAPSVTPPATPPAAGSDGVQHDWEKRYKDLQSLHDRSSADKEKELEAAKAEILSLQNLRAFKEELAKNPLGVLGQYFPQLAEKLNPRTLIQQKLREEFKEELDAYVDADAYREGTTSFRIRQREDELREEIQRQRLESEMSRTEETRRREGYLKEQIEIVKKEYGLDDKSFETEIVAWAKTQPPMGPREIARLKYFDYHIAKAVKDALAGAKKETVQAPPPSVTAVGGDDKEAEPSHDYQDLQNTFGDM